MARCRYEQPRSPLPPLDFHLASAASMIFLSSFHQPRAWRSARIYRTSQFFPGAVLYKDGDAVAWWEDTKFLISE